MTWHGNERLDTEFGNPVLGEPFKVETIVRQKPPIIPREEWGALPPKSVERTYPPLTRVFFTLWTETDECHTKEECIRIMKDLQQRHMDKGLSDIKYNFLVGGDGNIYEGRGWDAKSSKCLEFNPGLYQYRLDIAYIGDYRSVENPPNIMLERALDFVSYGEFLKKIQSLRELFKLQGGKEVVWHKIVNFPDEKEWPFY